MPRILLLLPTTTYRAADFIAAAERMSVNVVAASEKPNTMSRFHPDKFLTLNFRDLEASVSVVREFHSRCPLDAVVPVDDETAIAASAIGDALCLKHNSVESAQAARNKFRLSQLLHQHSVPTPRSERRPITEDPETLARQAAYPCILKPLFLSASRGVIRANNPFEYTQAWKRIITLLKDIEIRTRGGPAADYILEQEFISGAEFALEGLLKDGTLRVLAIFDKPDPLDGPYFEETIYVTPSRASEVDQQVVRQCVSEAARAIGLREGPIHAEVRLNSRGPCLIEIAARSIGGLCSRTLKFGTGLSLEDLIIGHAIGMDFDEVKRERKAAGVMMIPIPHKGILQETIGLTEARAVPFIDEVTITARPGNPLVPLPEGSSYLGFIFARTESPDKVEQALRDAHSKLVFVITTEDHRVQRSA